MWKSNPPIKVAIEVATVSLGPKNLRRKYLEINKRDRAMATTECE